MAAKQIGLEEIPVIFLDVDDAQAERILLVDNRSNDVATYDTQALADLLQSLGELEGTGYDEHALDMVLQALQQSEPFDPEQEWQNMPEFDQPDARPFRTLIVHFKSAEAVADFALRIDQDFGPDARYIYHPKQEKVDRTHQRYE